MNGAGLSLAELIRLTGGRLGRHDIACPLCGPFRRSQTNQRRPVLRVWRLDPGFATYACARCGEHGWTRDEWAPPPDPVKLAMAKAEAAERERIAATERLSKARWLWSKHQPIPCTVAETYLRGARGYGGPLPATLGFLSGREDYPPAMIAAYALPDELEPGILGAPLDVRAVHLTRLRPDGSDRERCEKAKITINSPRAHPIVLAPPNDLLGLAVTEGIEDGLTVHQATGLGVWVAGSASFMPALADTVPSYAESLTIYAHNDGGKDFALQLANSLAARGIEIRIEGLRR